MSNSIANLLLRNLSDVFGENDPVCRRAAIDEIFHEDAVFYDPKGRIFPVRDEIDHIAGVIKQHIQTSNISPSSLPDALKLPKSTHDLREVVRPSTRLHMAPFLTRSTGWKSAPPQNLRKHEV